MTNTNLIDYRVPQTSDLPGEQFDTVLIERGDSPGPYGAKGAGESGILGIAPAIANALATTGVHPTELPLTPERVFWALRRGTSQA